MRFVLVAVLVLGVLPPAAFGGSERVARARKAYEELRFDDVLAEVAAGRKAGDLTHAEDLELTQLEAFTYAVFDDEKRSVAAFRRLIALSPGYQVPPGTSPKIQRYFAAAKKAPAAAVALSAPPPKPKPRPFYASAWFWGAVAAAVGLGVGVGVVLEVSAD